MMLVICQCSTSLQKCFTLPISEREMVVINEMANSVTICKVILSICSLHSFLYQGKVLLQLRLFVLFI